MPLLFCATNLQGDLDILRFGMFWQLMGCFCGYLLPTQDGLTSKMRVNGKFLASRWVTLYRSLFRNHTTYSISTEIQDGCYWLICVRKRHESNQGCLQWRFKKYYVFREDTCPLIFLSLLPLAFHYVLNKLYELYYFNISSNATCFKWWMIYYHFQIIQHNK